jgi:hypothetical protein
MNDFHAIKWITHNIATRKTREVDLRCEILDGGKRILLQGTADLEHHLVEDAAILLKKMAEVKCGH